MEPEPQERHFNIQIEPQALAGVYANFANVSHSDYEFTITFARVDHDVEGSEVPGVAVVRVNLSPLFMRQLIDALQDNYSKWSTRQGIKLLPEYDGDDDRRRRRDDAVRRARGRPADPLLRVAVISDVHRNLQALEAVLEHADREGFDELWCLGDIVGYGGNPSECLAIVHERTAICLAGNHDLVVCGRARHRRVPSDAAVAARWTRSVLTRRRARAPGESPAAASSTASRSTTARSATRSGST